jgi:hypothetical protein
LLLSGAYTNNALMAGVMGIINTKTLSGDAAVMAFMDGDSGVTTCRAALVLQWLKPHPALVLSLGLS